VLAKAVISEVLAQHADGTVHGGDLGITLPEHLALRTLHGSTGFIGGQLYFFMIFGRQVIIKGEVFWQAAVWLMRGAEPDDGEEGLVFLLGAVNEAEGFLDEDLRAFSFDDFRRCAVAGEGGIHLE